MPQNKAPKYNFNAGLGCSPLHATAYRVFMLFWGAARCTLLCTAVRCKWIRNPDSHIPGFVQIAMIRPVAVMVLHDFREERTI